MQKKTGYQSRYPYSLLAFIVLIGLAACNYPWDDAGIGCDVAGLIAAINNANADPDPDTIVLGDECLYSLTDADNDYDMQGLETGEDGANGLPVIRTPITIEGNDSRIVRGVNPGIPEFRIFFIAPDGDLTLNNTYVEMGLVQSSSRSNNGGAIYIHYGSLTLNQSHVMNSTAADLGGGIYIAMGTLTSNNTSISFNQARSGGAIASFNGTIVIDGYSVLGNNTSSEHGGAIANGGSLTIHGSRFDDNQAGFSGGAIVCPGSQFGAGELVLDDVLFNHNIAELDGGAVYLKNGCSFTVSDSHFTLNQSTSGYGGAIRNDSVGSINNGSRIDNNSSTLLGGAIYNDLTGVLNIEASTLWDNTVVGGSGGAIANYGEMTVQTSTIENNLAASGGGIFNTGTIFIVSSTLNGNEGTAIFATPVYLTAALGDTDPYTSLLNTTVSANQGELQGGVYIRGRGAIAHSTIVNNNCNAAGCGVQLARDLGETQIKNSLVVDNNPSDCYFGAGPYENIAVGENLDSDGSCHGFSNSVVPMLGSLADNGGPTQTHALQPGSPALNMVTDCSDIAHNPLTEDQRGESRPSPPGGQCDVGAFEAQSVPLPPSQQTATPTSEPEVKIIIETLCWRGPGSNYDTVQSFKAGDQVSLAGLGEDEEYAVVYSPLYPGATCWVLRDHLAIPEGIGELPIIKAPPTPTPEAEPKPTPTCPVGKSCS